MLFVAKLDKQHVIAALIAVLAAIRLGWLIFSRIFLLLVLALAAGACLQNVGALDIPFIDRYLEKIPIDAAITLMGLLMTGYGALNIWRKQKRDEILAFSADEIGAFFDNALARINRVHAYVCQLRDFQSELALGPYPISALWHAAHLSAQVKEIQSRIGMFHQSAISVHSLDGKWVQALTFYRATHGSFKKAKKALLDLDGLAYLHLPISYEDPSDFIDYVRLLPDGAYKDFIDGFQSLSTSIAGGAGGVRGGIYARFFPPTFSFARAVLTADRDP